MNKPKIKKYLFFDIETHRVNNWNELGDSLKRAYSTYYAEKGVPIEESFNKNSALHPEFSHVISISFGYEDATGNYSHTNITTLDEKELLNKTSYILKSSNDNGFTLAGHNIIGFDIPYLVKRYIINEMKVPTLLNFKNKKPWEIDVLDTMNLWKLGSSRSSSLMTICSALGIASKSEDVSGSNLYLYDIKDVPLDELAKYCDEDVKSDYLMYNKIKQYL